MNNIRKQIDNTIKYLCKSFTLDDLKKDPENIIFESELDLNDEEYNEAINYIKSLQHE